MPWLFYSLALVSLLSTGQIVRAAEMTAECPSRIPGTVVKQNQPIDGWTVKVAEQLHLSGSGMLAGAPETETYLVPSRQTKDTHTYGFNKGDGERWLWCRYGGAGGVELAKRLDDKATTCTITNKTKKRENTMTASVSCW
jgi:hypothetical protein